jgi:hypothetical protein
MILNIHPVGDGMWFWYGRLFQQHQLLYAGMHLPLQPLFVFLTVLTQKLFGTGWLASKTLALVQLAMVCWGQWLIAGRIPWEDFQRGMLLAASFILTLTAPYSRFDDYHVTGYCFVLFSVYLLARLPDAHRTLQIIGGAALLGVLSGLSVSNRLNDGASLLAGCACVLPFTVRRGKWAAVLTFCGVAAATFLCIILLTGDSLREWRLDTIVRAAKIKGGQGRLLSAPLQFAKTQLTTTLIHRNTFINVVLAGLVMALATYLWTELRRVDGRDRWKTWLAGLLLLGILLEETRQAWSNWTVVTIGLYGMLFLLGMVVWRLVQIANGLRTQSEVNLGWRHALIIIPLLQLASGILTAGGTNLEIFPAIALFLLILPLCTPNLLVVSERRVAITALAGLIFGAGVITKSRDPYVWHHFKDQSLFVGRVWYRHPVYGEIYIGRDQLQMMQNICSTIRSEGSPRGLLEITNPYANWFCDVPPWHGYVQTWYDTSSREMIEGLISELESAPPQWIVYQRAPDTLRMNEIGFGGGHVLPHRELDSLIMKRIGSGAWVVAYEQQFEDADWMVVRTAPTVGGQGPAARTNSN